MRKEERCVQLNAILVQGIKHVLMQRVEQAECFLMYVDLTESRSALIYIPGVHIYAL